MFTYQIMIEYLGTNFVGWQIQTNGISVQEVLEKVLSRFLKYWFTIFLLHRSILCGMQTGITLKYLEIMFSG